MFYQILQKLVRQFFLSKGRAPRSAMEWQQLRARARELASEQGGIPSIKSKTTIDSPREQTMWDFSKDLPTRDVQSQTADVIPFPSDVKRPLKQQARSLGLMDPKLNKFMRKGDIKLGEAPKTTKETLRRKKDVLEGQIDKEMWIKRKNEENKAAVDRFNRKWGKPDERKTKTVEDFRDEGDWDPSGMAYGGIAPLVGEPSYAADFYDDRTPMKRGKKPEKKKKKRSTKFFTRKEWPPSLRTADLREAAREKREEAEFEGIWRGAPPSMKDREKMYRKERTANLMEEERKEAFAKKIDERKKLYPYEDLTEEEFAKSHPKVYDFMKKDPAFDFETFKKVSFANIGETFQAQGARDYRGEGLPLGRTNTEELELFMTPFGDEAQEMTTEGPIYGQKRQMSDIDKAAVVLHELRHKKILEEDVLTAAQPPLAVEDIEWRHKGPSRYGIMTTDDTPAQEEKPPPMYRHANPPGAKDKFSHPLSMHELFIRYLDDQYGHTDTPSGPYFDKIWRDEWKPYADRYEGILGAEKSEMAKPIFRDEFRDRQDYPLAQGGRIGMAGGGAILKFIEKLFLKASNDIRQGKGKWKGLTQDQWIKKHDDLTKKLKEWEMGGKKRLPEGASEYLGMNDIQIANAVKKPQVIDERTMIKQKFPGITDDLVENILIDDNPQRKAEVLATMDQFLKLKEMGKGSEEAFQIVTESIKNPIKHAEGGRADFIFGGSAGLRALIKRLRGKEKRLFPSKLGIEHLMTKGDKDYIKDLKLKQLETLLEAAQTDKKLMKQLEANKAMRDPGLDFLMGKFDEMGMMPKNLSKYTDVDKDIVDIEMMIKNYGEKKLKRKSNAEGGRIEYAGGGLAGLPPITQGLPQGPGIQQPPMAAGPQPAGIPGGTIVAQNQMQQNPWMGSQMQQGIGGMPRAQMAGGGMGRRAFMKLLAAMSAAPFVGKGISKVAPKAIPKVTETIVQSNAVGMPPWFPSLVKRVLKEGEDITDKAAIIERQTVHSAKLPESGTELIVTRDLSTDDVIVDIGYGKHGWSEGRHGQPARLVLKKGEWIEPTKGKKGIKTKDEFYVDEAEFTGGHPENIKYEESVSEVYGDHASDFTEIEKFAIGKNTDKKIIGKKRAKDDWAEGRAEAEWDQMKDEGLDDPDYASGGVARMLGE